MQENDQAVCLCEVVEAGEVAVRGVSPLCPEHGDPRDTSVDPVRRPTIGNRGKVTGEKVDAFLARHATARVETALSGEWLSSCLALFQALEQIGSIASVRLTVHSQGREVLLAEYKPEKGGSR